jgi:NAD(P)H-dependent FMN reductase
MLEGLNYVFGCSNGKCQMKVIGFSAGSVGREGNTDRIVKAILEKSGHDVEFVKLTDLNFSGCKGCVQLCARPQVCKLEDDAQPFYEKIMEADAVVIGTPVYIDNITATVRAFIERFYGYRHVEIQIAGKPVVTVVSGAMMLDSAVEQFHKMLGVFDVDMIDTVIFTSKVPPCFKCGRHKECKIGGAYMMLGDAAKELTITKEMFTRWEDDSTVAAAVDAAAEKLKSI